MAKMIDGRSRDLGGFNVIRFLPAPTERMIGPFIFVDQMGPVQFASGQGIDVRPHPHIGLATFTYLFEGSIFHKDSLGTEIEISPGAVNWMTSGHGIAHSERTAPARRKAPHRLYGLQSWVALPTPLEDQDPAFDHYPTESIPVLTNSCRNVRVVVGSLENKTSPVKTPWETFFFDITTNGPDVFDLPTSSSERGVLVLTGNLKVNDQTVSAGQLYKIEDNQTLVCEAKESTHYVVFGGKPFPDQRFIWWNFVSSSQEKIDLARKRWKEDLFPRVPGETERIPLPET